VTQAMGSSDNYWFPAKTYGWGWGMPIRWQGWVVLAAYLLALVTVSIFARPSNSPAAFVCGVVVATCALVLMCWITGEPPSWRWGDRINSEQRDAADSQ
jgi:hypothetical protein